MLIFLILIFLTNDIRLKFTRKFVKLTIVSTMKNYKKS